MVWSSSFVIMPWYQYLFYGDTAVLEENYSAILRYLNYLASQGKLDIQPRERGTNPLFDEPILDPLMTGHLQQSQWGDHLSLSEEWHSRSGLPLSISTAFYYHDVDDIEVTHDGHLTTGYIGTKYLLDLLTQKGREDLVWQLALKTDFPSWGYFLRDGRTTITEKWTGGSSLNHVVLDAAIDPWFYNVLASVCHDDRSPGFKHCIIKPFVPDSDLDWVKASVNTLYGTISSSWQKKSGGLVFEIEIPVNTTATLHLPALPGTEITENRKPVSRARGVRLIKFDDNEAVFEVGSGTYSFSVSGGTSGMM